MDEFAKAASHTLVKSSSSLVLLATIAPNLPVWVEIWESIHGCGLLVMSASETKSFYTIAGIIWSGSDFLLFCKMMEPTGRGSGLRGDCVGSSTCGSDV